MPSASSVEDSLCEAERVALYGVREPLMNPDIVKMVSSAKKVMSESGRIALYTNGSLLTPKLASKMVEVGLTSVYVSLDSLNVERLKITRRGIDHAGVLRSLEFLLKTFGSDVEVGLEYVVMKENLGELPGFVAEATRMVSAIL